MKVFLNICMAAMISAGIYGGIDLVSDLRNGNFIQYEKEDSPIKMIAAKQEAKQEPALVKAIRRETVKKVPAEKHIGKISMAEFSRSAMPIDYESLVLEQLAASDSANVTATRITDSLHAAADTSVAPAEIKKEPVAEVKERKFSVRLYSRSRPRPMAHVIPADSAKNEEIKIESP